MPNKKPDSGGGIVPLLTLGLAILGAVGAFAGWINSSLNSISADLRQLDTSHLGRMGKINDDSQGHFLTLTERVARLESRQITSFAPAPPAEAQEIPRRGTAGGGRSVFRWQDENGQPGYAEGIGNVPARYRSKARPWTGPSAVAGN